MEFETNISDCAFNIIPIEGFCSDQNSINALKQTIQQTGDLLSILKQKYSCQDEICILKQQDIKKILGDAKVVSIIKNNFKPIGPSSKSAWLSNFEIDSVLEQFAKKHKDFYHIPFQMIDFELTQSELSIFDWPMLYKQGYRTFGTIINTDISTGNGIHWFAIFGDFRTENPTIEYFNSSGQMPMNQIIYWARKKIKEWSSIGKIKFVIATNIINQQNNWDCGPYSLYYVISRLEDIPYIYFKFNKIGDDRMQAFRDYLFLQMK